VATADVARYHQDALAALATQLERYAARQWRHVDQGDIAGSWAVLLLPLLAELTAAQETAATSAEAYLAAVLAAQGITPDIAGLINPAAFAGIASDGRPLASLLAQPATVAKVALSRGATVRRALAAGQASAQIIARLQVTDAGRVADGVALTATRAVPGYVRMLNPPSCSRCVVLAGRVYEWNAGFDRHPHCDCVHVPAAEDVAGDLRTDPRAHFDSLSVAEQDRIFTQAGAAAIRDGADINRVVNARRGMETAARAAGGRGGRLIRRRVFGRDLFVTTEAVTRRGVNRPVRLMPESIYEIAGNDRAEAVRLLRAHGYIR
jgi:hypothetical protein